MASPLEICNAETHSCQCQCEDCGGQGFELESESETVTSLNIFTWQLNCLRLENHAKDFQAKTGINVNIQCITSPLTRDKFHDEILSDAKTQTGLYDGYTLGPHLYGDLDLLEGLYDLTPLVRSGTIGSMAGYDFAWNDIFLFARENGAVYDRKVVGIPIDGDVHTLYYRSDLFEKYNKKPPATWEEYSELAKFFHEREETIPGTNMTVPISGSCVGKLERTEFWVFLILSSMTQYAGTKTGALFDPRNGKNMEPLLGEAFVKTLKFMEEQFIYGADNEYEGSFADVNLNRMNSGRCAMTYNWGDAFTEAAKAPPTSLISGYLGTAHTPGSPVYLDRDTQTLEPCTEDICTCGNEFYPGHEDDGTCLNAAPYAAFTGWSAACSNFVSPAQQRACAEFIGYVSSPDTSIADTIPNITVGAPVITVDPYRMSQTELSDWVERGLPEQSTKEYLDTIKTQLSSPNVVLDMRFPAAAAFQSEMNAVFRDHLTVLQSRKDAGMQGEDILSTEVERWKVEQDIRARWKDIIATYDRTHASPLLEAYQRNLGVYVPPEDSGNQLGIGPLVGIVAVVAAVVLAAMAYVRWEKNKKIDKSWRIKSKDLTFDDPPKVVGRGRFGVVTLAEYRGTEVAVKRIIAPNKRGALSSDEVTDRLGEHSKTNASGVSLSQDEESAFTGSASSNAKKTMASGSMDPKVLKKNFMKEMRLLSTLRHPCIATAVGAVVNTREDPLMVMEYMHHGSLHDILQNPAMPLEPAMLLDLLRDISQGMRFLHASNPPIIHCDLKAANVLVDNKWRAKIADFGLSRKEAKAAGTPFWMAPELIRGTSTNTMASDVYAFGIVLYEVYSRKDPYEGDDPAEVLKLVCNSCINKRPPVPENCPPTIQSLMEDCQVSNPEERPTFEELDKRLKRVDVKAVEATGTGLPNSSGHQSSLSLFDIFPKKVAEALRDGKRVEPELHDMVTIFFCDIVGYTNLSGTLEPQQVAGMLRRFYGKLDKLSTTHEVFKVETIGDAYMAVTNLVQEQAHDHAKRISDFAADAIAAANSTYIDIDNPDRGVLEIRVGLHSGPVVADVVGSINPRYCLFGDTVNIASRMESNSKANSIHCSKEAAEQLEIQDLGTSLTSRGRIHIKGKGLMETYWVNKKASTPKDLPESAPETAPETAPATASESSSESSHV